MINIKDFDPSLLKIDKKLYKNIDIYYTEYITLKDSYYVIKINRVYIKEKNGSKYLIFDSVNENSEVLEKYNELWDGITNQIETINGGKTSKHSSVGYDKDFTKIKFNSNNSLPLNKTLKLHNMAIVIRSVFEEHGKFYPHVYLDESLYQL